MKVKIRIQRPLFSATPQRLVAQVAQPVRVERTFQATLSDCAEDWVVQRQSPAPTPPPTPVARRVQPPVEKPQSIRPRSGSHAAKSKPQQPAVPGSLTKAFTWLQSRYALSAVKRLRVSETVSLGEKRFVAIVKVEGREFLIGGGPQGVSLLTTLEASPAGKKDLSGNEAPSGNTIGNTPDGLDSLLDLDIAGDGE